MRTLDPVLLSVIANRLDGIVREMTNTLLRAARSAVISSARDFSCCIVTGNVARSWSGKKVTTDSAVAVNIIVFADCPIA